MSLGLIEIDHERVSEDENLYRLYVEGNPKATLRLKKDDAQLIWQVYGPQYWPQAELLIQGLLELSILADSQRRTS